MLTNEECTLVQTALAWEPYGGPTEEDLFVNFGLSTEKFYERIRVILSRDRNGRHLGTSVHQTLVAMCRLHDESALRRRSDPISLS